MTGSVDVDATLNSRDAFTSHWDDKSQVQWIEDTGATLLRGHARLASDRTAAVEAADGTTQMLTARRGARLVVDRTTRTMLGATFTGPGVGQMLHAATIAIVSGTTLEQLWHAIPAFPTMSEVWLRLLETDRGTA